MRLSLLFASLLLLTSCTSVMLSGAGLGVSYTIANVAYKTLNHPMENVGEATEKALRDLDMRLIEKRGSRPLKKIEAVTIDLDIRITIEEITKRATRIKVDARKGPVFKDRATAAAIIERVERVLEGES